MFEQQRSIEDRTKNSWWSYLKPTLPKRWLLIVAGAMWSAVGIMLLNYAVTWLTLSFSIPAILLGVLGIILSVMVNRWGFSKIALKNIERILALNEKACLFSFQAWKSYLLILVMVSTGIFLRNSAIPKVYLAVVCTTIGGALIQASVKYYTRFFSLNHREAS